MRSKCIFFLLLSFAMGLLGEISLSANPGEKGRVENSYNLRFLKKAGSPRQMRLADLGNLGRKGKKIIAKGILFTYRNRKASFVQIAGNFSRWKPLSMEKNEHGIWYFFLDETRNLKSTIKYKFRVDSTWIPDPLNSEKSDDGTGSFISLVQNPGESFSQQISYRILENNMVEFRIYRPEARFISLVGDFNNWNPENDILEKGDDGIWRLVKHIPSGSFLYRYVIDGQWVQDIYNPESASDITGDLNSVITME